MLLSFLSTEFFVSSLIYNTKITYFYFHHSTCSNHTQGKRDGLRPTPFYFGEADRWAGIWALRLSSFPQPAQISRWSCSLSSILQYPSDDELVHHIRPCIPRIHRWRAVMNSSWRYTGQTDIQHALSLLLHTRSGLAGGLANQCGAVYNRKGEKLAQSVGCAVCKESGQLRGHARVFDYNFIS